MEYSFNNALKGLKAGEKIPKLYATNLQYMSKFVAAIDLGEGFMEELQKDTITASDGDTISGSELKCFIRMVTEHTYTQYFEGNNDPIFNAAVPYLFYCHKLHNGTPYETWRNTKWVEILLGKHFKGLLTCKAMVPYDIDRAMRLRSLALRRKGEPMPATSWNIVKTKQDTQFDSLPKCVKLMVLQSWKLNVKNRNKYMILDPVNWDIMPEALDEVALTVQEEWDQMFA